MPKEYRTIQEVAGPLMLVKGVENVGYDELGEIELSDGTRRRCKVLQIDEGNAMVQLFENATGINLDSSKVRFFGKSMELGVSEDMLGRMFDGLGRPIDGGPDIIPDARMDINGLPINPAARAYPSEFIQFQSAYSALKSMMESILADMDTSTSIDNSRLTNLLNSYNTSATILQNWINAYMNNLTADVSRYRTSVSHTPSMPSLDSTIVFTAHIYIDGIDKTEALIEANRNDSGLCPDLFDWTISGTCPR